MKILHTADWHLGASLDGKSRYEEQIATIDEIAKIADDKQVDVILIAGDVFVNPNMPPFADHMFEKALLKLCNNGNRAIVAISGNNDIPERFVACKEFALKQNCFLFNNLNTNFEENDIARGKDIELTNYGKGYIELTKNGEKLVVAFMPYPAFFGEEKTKADEDNIVPKIERLMNLASLGFKDDAFNIMLAHFFVPNKISNHDSYFEVPISAFPENANYVALGHLHHNVCCDETRNIYDSGSTINLYYEPKIVNNYVILLNTTNNKLNSKQIIKLNNPKTMLKVTANNYLDAVEKLSKVNVDYAKLYIKELNSEEFKKLKSEFSFLTNISILPAKLKKPNKNLQNNLESEKVFIEFYKNEYNKEPSSKLVNCFNKLIKGDK